MSATAESFTLTEAAEVTGRSRVTMRRYLDAGKFPNAFRDLKEGDGPAPWRIPRGDLLAAGLPLDGGAGRKGAAATPSDTPPMSGAGGEVAPATAVDLGRLREELAAVRAVADERGRTIDVLIAQVTELRTLLADALATTRLLSGGGRVNSEV